jgi:hypothetical protein
MIEPMFKRSVDLFYFILRFVKHLSPCGHLESVQVIVRQMSTMPAVANEGWWRRVIDIYASLPGGLKNS